MTAFVWQSLLLLGLAYVLGCWIACLLRRMVSVSVRTAVPADAVPAAAIAGAAAAGAAMRQAAAVSAPQVVRPPAVTPVPMRDAFRRADTLEPDPESARPKPPPAMPSTQRAGPHSGSVDRFERALTRAPGAGDGLAAAPVAARAVGGGRGANDLTRIRKIDGSLQEALHKLGVRTFAEIGAWKSADVTRVSQALGFKGRIEQENWIEQAQILASGRETYYSSRLGLAQATSQPAAIDHRPPAATGVPAAPPPIRPAAASQAANSPRGGIEVATATAAAMAAAAAAAKVPPAAPSTAAAATPAARPAPSVAGVAPAEQASHARPAVPARDDLTRIQGVTSDIEKLLNSHGIMRFAQVARWRETDIARFGGLLGQPARIQRENWIAQAAHLERTSSQPPDAGNAVQPVTRVPAPSQPVPGAPTQSVPAVKPADQPRPAQPATPASPSPMPAALSALPQPPPAQKPSDQPAVPGVPGTKPPVPPPSSAQPSNAAADAPKPSPTPSPAGSAPPQLPPAQKPPGQPAAPSVPVTKPAASPPSSAQPHDAAPDAPKSAPALTPAPASAPPQPPSEQKPPVQSAASSVPLTKPAAISPSLSPASPAAPSVVASASVAGAAVASLAATAEAAAAARRSEVAAPGNPVPDPTPTAGAPISPKAPSQPDGAVREVSGPAPPSDPEQSRGELGHLRSVRSEGLRGYQSALEPRSGSGMDDLKRIRGIGVLIEKKLNSMGVTRYEQIAKWTVTDIDRVSHVLDFKGRIERENWVEQARILASGGQTEFSRRADRGEFGGL